MAFDFGLRQIGVAAGNTEFCTTQPLAVLPAKNGVPDWSKLEQLVREWQPDLLLVGDPLNMDGSTSAMGDRASRFARQLHGRLGLAVEMADERLSSFAAKEQQRERGHRGNYKRRPVDAKAAQLILETWLRQNASR